MGRRVGSRRGEAEYFNRPIITCSSKVLVRGIESEAFYVTLMVRQRLQLFKGVC